MKRNWLLLLIPVGIALDLGGANPLLVFVASALAIIPLAGLKGDATEALAKYLGPTVGGLLNASLGNRRRSSSRHSRWTRGSSTW